MNILKCSVAGCTTEISVNEPVSAKARFICKNHLREEQLKAVGRRYNPEKDEQDREASFQGHQFDKELKHHRKAVGTSHIQNKKGLTPEQRREALGEIPTKE